MKNNLTARNKVSQNEMAVEKHQRKKKELALNKLQII